MRVGEHTCWCGSGVSTGSDTDMEGGWKRQGKTEVWGREWRDTEGEYIEKWFMMNKHVCLGLWSEKKRLKIHVNEEQGEKKPATRQRSAVLPLCLHRVGAREESCPLQCWVTYRGYDGSSSFISLSVPHSATQTQITCAPECTQVHMQPTRTCA